MDASSDGGDDSDGSVGPQVDEECAIGDLALGPAPAQTDGLNAIPIDIERIVATIVLDGFNQQAEAEARVVFRTGPNTGMPIFDLRQDIMAATLDGEDLDPVLVAAHDFGGGDNAELRVVEREVGPCTLHTLRLTYPLARPQAPDAARLGWMPDSSGLHWDFFFTDSRPGRYLEMWLPANLIFDRFSMQLEIRLDSDVAHTLITNAEVTQLADHHWRLEFPPTFTALSPMLVLRPSEIITSATTSHTFGNGQTIQIEVHRLNTVTETMPSLLDRILSAIETFIVSTGDYLHGDRFTFYIWDRVGGSMEYDGATTTTPMALEHEVFHSWYGRGIKPASGADGWLDEAWTTYNVSAEPPLSVVALPDYASTMLLAADNPWSRHTPNLSYAGGNQLFAHIATFMGLELMRTRMAELYAEHGNGLVTTLEVEKQLYCVAQEREIAQAFFKYVYGQEGAIPDSELPSCE